MTAPFLVALAVPVPVFSVLVLLLDLQPLPAVPPGPSLSPLSLEQAPPEHQAPVPAPPMPESLPVVPEKQMFPGVELWPVPVAAGKAGQSPGWMLGMP